VTASWVPFLERAVKLQPKSGDASFALAQSLWLAGQDRGRARTLAADALALFTAEGPAGAEHAAEVRRWSAKPH